MIYSEVRDRIVFGVIRRATSPPSLNRLRAVVDAAFPQINSQVSQEYAAQESKRSQLRTVKSLTFSGGTATLTDDVLKSYLDDCTLLVAGAAYAYRREYADFLANVQSRLGVWSANGATIYANTAATAGSGSTGLVGAASFTCIASPAIPATEIDTFVAPPDFVSDFIDSGIDFILSGKTFSQSAAATT